MNRDGPGEANGEESGLSFAEKRDAAGGQRDAAAEKRDAAGGQRDATSRMPPPRSESAPPSSPRSWRLPKLRQTPSTAQLWPGETRPSTGAEPR